MKAAVYHRYGPPEVLQLEEIEKPVPADNEILVKIHATTVSSGDCRMRSFTVPPMFWLPGRIALGIRGPKQPILGMVLAGEVEAVGKDVTRFAVGDHIFGAADHGRGAYAEYHCMPDVTPAAIKPDSLSWEQAAAIPFGAITALYFLRQRTIEPGQEVLINGASGAVGTFAVQLAKYFGAVVTAVCGPANLELVKSLGADHVIDYTRVDFTKSGETYDIVFDVVGNTAFAQCRDTFKEGGVYLHAVMVLAWLKAPWWAMRTGIQVVGGTAVPTSEDLSFLADLVEDGEIHPVIDRRYPLEQIVEAHSYVDTGHKKGVVIIKVV